MNETEVFAEGLKLIKGLKVIPKSIYQGGSSIEYKGLLFEYDYVLQCYREWVGSLEDQIEDIGCSLVQLHSPEAVKDAVDETTDYWLEEHEGEIPERIELQNC